MAKTANKFETTRNIMALAAGTQRKCTKLEQKNIVFPKWADMGLIGTMFRQCLRTKEQPDGNIYDESKFQTVLRVLGGTVIINNQPDAYCWKFDKVLSANEVKSIGVNCADSILTLMGVLEEIKEVKQKKLLADMFCKIKEDFLLVTTPKEERSCIEITPKLYTQGITFCVDEWMDTDENGDTAVTELEIGDFLIVTGEDSLYRIGRKEFMETHNIS